MRAADIARELGIPANQASFHLRQLAKYGLAVEAPELARDGRDRVWKAVHEDGLNVNPAELALAPGGQAAVTVFRRQWTNAAHDAVNRADASESNRETLVMVSDAALRLTREDAEELRVELTSLMVAWRDRGRAAGPEARTYQVLQILQPAADVPADDG